MTTTLFSQSVSLETWRRLALGAATLVLALLATIATILIVGTSHGGSQPPPSTPNDPNCQPTAVVHVC